MEGFILYCKKAEHFCKFDCVLSRLLMSSPFVQTADIIIQAGIAP